MAQLNRIRNRTQVLRLMCITLRPDRERLKQREEGREGEGERGVRESGGREIGERKRESEERERGR